MHPSGQETASLGSMQDPSTSRTSAGHDGTSARPVAAFSLVASPIIRPPCSHSIESFPFRAHLQPNCHRHLAAFSFLTNSPQPSHFARLGPQALRFGIREQLMMHPLIGRSLGGHESSRTNRFLPPSQPAAAMGILSHQFGLRSNYTWRQRTYSHF